MFTFLTRAKEVYHDCFLITQLATASYEMCVDYPLTDLSVISLKGVQNVFTFYNLQDISASP